MTKKFVPCCGEHHVVQADSRLCGSRPWIHASVVFRKRSELDELIVALEKLREDWDHPAAHFHLQDYDLASRPTDPSRLEVMFSTPTWSDIEAEAELRMNSIAAARKSLAKKA